MIRAAVWQHHATEANRLTPPRPATPEPAASLATGIGLTLLAGFSFASLDSLGKHVMVVLPFLQVMWARYLVHSMLATGYLAATSGARFVHTRRPALQIARGLCLLCASFCVYMALQHLPIGDVTALVFFSPVVVTVLSVVVLKERIGLHRILAVAAALVGVGLIVQPTSLQVNPYHLLVLCGATLNAIYLLMTRALAGAEESAATQFHTTALGTVVLSAAVLLEWRTPDAVTAAQLLVMGVLAAVGHFSLQRAFAHAPASMLSPYLYGQVVFAMLYGVVWFGDVLRPVMLAGTVLIVGSGLYIWWRERLRAAR